MKLALALLILLAAPLARAQQTLLYLTKPIDPSLVKATGAKLSQTNSALRVETFHKDPWPGMTLIAPGGHWNLSKFDCLSIALKNVGTNAVTVNCRVDNPGADGSRNCVTVSLKLAPGQSGILETLLGPKDTRLFGMRGYPIGHNPKGASIDTANITQLLLFITKPTADHAFEVTSIRALNSPAAGPAGEAFFPFIDTFGQYMHADWPGKVHSLKELTARRDDEARDLAAKPGPADWNQYGGWKTGPTLKATAFFRTEKRDGKWWLVDPEGKLFFSHGIDCVRSLNITPIEQRDNWFADFPGLQPDFKEFISPSNYALHGYYAGKSPRGYGFAAANLKRKYGPDWRTASADIAHRRLRSWGMNTIANWSDRSVSMLRKTPYTATIHTGGRSIEGSQGYWGKFVDPFDPSFKDSIRKAMAREAGKSVGDPWCLGYFVDNEIAWNDETSLAIGALQSPANQPAKLAFIEDLKAKYATIEKLNAAWGTTHASWDALLNFHVAPDKNKANADLTAFYTRVAEQYFRTIRDAVKEAAPNQLYLGCRFAWTNALAATAAGKYCDVVSYNLYRTSVADFKYPGNADVPLIIGEFHFGALDRGMFHTGLVPTASQADRAQAYKDYVTGCLRHPQFVGCHWFEYQDEPTTGRSYDEENYQIGFIDIADTPYPETINAARQVGYEAYPIRSAK